MAVHLLWLYVMGMCPFWASVEAQNGYGKRKAAYSPIFWTMYSSMLSWNRYLIYRLQSQHRKLCQSPCIESIQVHQPKEVEEGELVEFRVGRKLVDGGLCRPFMFLNPLSVGVPSRDLFPSLVK